LVAFEVALADALAVLVTLEAAKVEFLVTFDLRATFGWVVVGFLMSISLALVVLLAVAFLVVLTWRALTTSLIGLGCILRAVHY